MCIAGSCEICESTPSLGNWTLDPTGDTVNNGTVGDYDISRAKAVLYPDVVGLEEYLNICIDINSSLPGMLVIEFDLDNDTLTGGTWLLGLFNSCESSPPSKIKITPGIDMALYLMLRNQSSNSTLAWCKDCAEEVTELCYLKDTPCDGSCGSPNCYEPITLCTPGDPNCYFAQQPCNLELPVL